MPGVIMESASRNGAHTNHDRDTMPNGTKNGETISREGSYDKVKARGESQAPMKQALAVNGLNGAPQGSPATVEGNAPGAIPLDLVDRLQQLPPEIMHITEGFEPLSRLLTRLAQVTHNRLSSKLLELASMPTPTSAVNGNGVHHISNADDHSAENLRKKVSLLKFAEETHANWTKALVMTHWSRVSDDVSKLIDLKVHLDGRRNLYDAAVYELSEVKRSLVHARVPNPDLRTAVEVLSTGTASWMPDLGYVDPPPLTAKELLKSLQDLNTLLSIRLNLHEYDKIPPHFKDYKIKSGRVTFRVAGEFEVDLTIADQDLEKQFWFIDFRFSFTPAASQIPENLRYVIEDRVNTALLKDGLSGCYKFLHELVLTYKISEIRRQAVELSRGRWIDTLQVEPLHRALSIQYWVDRYGKDGPKSWIILGVHSGRRKDGVSDPQATSCITLRWFRDSKEIKDHDIPLDVTSISAESLLRAVISRHIFHILGSTHQNLRTKPLFTNRQLSISFKVSDSQAKEPELTVQLTRHDRISITIEPVTGRFAISPASRLAMQVEWRLNNQTKDPAANAHEFIESLRCTTVNEEIISRALSVGWIHVRNSGLKPEDLKPILPRDTLQLSCFRRTGWSQDWIIALSFSMSGERWWLFETSNGPTGLNIKSHFQMPLGTMSPNHTHAFLSDLHLFASALVTYYANLQELYFRRANNLLQNDPSKFTSSTMKLPAIVLRLSDILPAKNRIPRTTITWAKDHLKIRFQGLEHPPKASGGNTLLSGTQSDLPRSAHSELPSSGTESDNRKSEEVEESAILIAEARLSKPLPSSLDLVKQRVDRDIAFHPTSGGFAFRLHTKVGQSAIAPLVERLQRVEQLVDFVDVIKKHEKTLQCQTISLAEVVFTYSNATEYEAASKHPNANVVDQQIKRHRAIIKFNGASTPMTITLETGNPQIRILDHLTKTLNSPLGLNGVATLLPLTLPLVTALDAIEVAWTPLVDDGEVMIFSRAIDWHIVRYKLTPYSSEQKARKVMIEIKLCHRRGNPWWCIRREKERDRNERRGSIAGDEIDIALSAVFGEDLEDDRARGMLTSVIATPDGVGDTIKKIDDIIRGLLGKGSSNAATDLKEIQQLLAPAAHPNATASSQNQRRNGQRREMIVID